MTTEKIIRVLAGSMILISVSLAHFVSPKWLLLTCFVGVNLIQSAITGFCPAGIVLKKLGVGSGSCCAPSDQGR
jgi:hypothetical protein